ncbi:DUF262 domain-containing protein [Acidithiobacillus ferruginosus]|uniref:DUF262 domain-containing protein n=1 Tax=Acidithiobacillus ferruginosus TaxID=3063951 RepID=A0ACD5IHE5_9PROT|nr:DUF262 domain-containing protein [Acidithiobacillus ferruginosus]MBU2815212.1 DUF262 domain-containing protein [Acidithiobacillus ferruginosus]
MEENDTADQWEVEQTEAPESEEQDVITYRISYYPADFTLKGYLDKHQSGQLVIPPFQRSYVWDQVKASKLIESFLLGLPVPGIFLYKERQTNKLQVIDGQQRILSAIRFFKNEFDERIFRLKNVNPRWDGKTYGELDEADQFQLNDTVLRATVVQQLDPQDDSSIYHIFERLNTGGINLNPMEIRKCVYFGKFFSHLEELNLIEPWRRLIGKPNIDRRLRDVELVLRVLALTYSSVKYEKPMKRFLNKFMLAHRRMDDVALDGAIQRQHKSFQEACERILDAVGEKPFHLRGRLNFAVLDSVMAAAIACPELAGKGLHDAFEGLKNDNYFVDKATRNTSDEATLEDRFNKAFEYISV